MNVVYISNMTQLGLTSCSVGGFKYKYDFKYVFNANTMKVIKCIRWINYHTMYNIFQLSTDKSAPIQTIIMYQDYEEFAKKSAFMSHLGLRHSWVNSNYPYTSEHDYISFQSIFRPYGPSSCGSRYSETQLQVGEHFKHHDL